MKGQPAKTKAKTQKTPVKNGRPRKEIDFEQLDALCQIQCTGEECAAILGIDADTLSARVQEKGYKSFSDYFVQKGAFGKKSLRRRQYEVAIGKPAEYDDEGNVTAKEIPPNPTMLIWLGKQWLGQNETVEVNHSDSRLIIDFAE